jgi:aminopeptidase
VSLLENAAKTAIEKCLAMKAGERLLIVSNPNTEQALIAEALQKVAEERGILATLLFQLVKNQGEYAEDFVLDAIAAKPDAVASISTEKLGKDRNHIAAPLTAPDGKKYDHIFHYLLHGTKEMRAFWSPGITVDMFTRTVGVDYTEMRSRAFFLKDILDEAIALQISAPSGTDIFISIMNRKTFLDDGDFGQPGSGGNLPAGEVFISPVVKSAQGTIVFDGSIADIAGDIIIETPISCAVSGGFVLECKGGAEAERLEKALRKGMDMASSLVVKGGLSPEEALRYATNARHIGELGIGLNVQARIGGNMLEDEKVYGTCHFAIGSNYDEDAAAMIHLDGLVKRPTITALMPDGREITVMRNGNLFSSIV